MIELKHINKIYNGFNALNDISLTIKDGEICGIIGQSGAGKSTLVRCINMLEPPTSGDVIVNGRNMVTLSKRELREERKKIGMIFQHFTSLPPPEDLASGSTDSSSGPHNTCGDSQSA